MLAISRRMPSILHYTTSCTTILACKFINDNKHTYSRDISCCSYPQRVSKLKASVRYMFHNPEDVRWFKVTEFAAGIISVVSDLSTMDLILVVFETLQNIGCSLWKFGQNAAVVVVLRSLLVHMVCFQNPFSSN